MTVEFWFNPKEGTEYHFMGNQQASGYSGWGFRTGSSGKLDLSYWSGTAKEFDVVSAVALTWNQGQWYHLAIVKDASSISLFRDGVCDSSTTYTGHLTSSYGNGTQGTLYIGKQFDSSFCTCFMDEIRISKMARYTGQGLIDSDYPNPSTQFGIQTEGSTYGRFDTQVTANTTYQRYNYQHGDSNGLLMTGSTSNYWTFSSAMDLSSGDFTVAGWNRSEVPSPAAWLGVIGEGTDWIWQTKTSTNEQVFYIGAAWRETGYQSSEMRFYTWVYDDSEETLDFHRV